MWCLRRQYFHSRVLSDGLGAQWCTGTTWDPASGVMATGLGSGVHLATESFLMVRWPLRLKEGGYWYHPARWRRLVEDLGTEHFADNGQLIS